MANENGKRPLPEGWVWTTLGEATDPSRERVQPREYATLPFVGMDDVSSGTMQLLGTKVAGEMSSSAEHFRPDDVLYGSLRPYLNKVYRPDFEGLCSAEFIVFRSVPHLASKYLQYFLNQWEFVEFINRHNTGDRPRVKFAQMADYSFPLPPLPEQQRIVAEIEKQFTRLDAAVAALKRARAGLARYKAAVLKAAVEGRLVPQDAADEPASELLERILAERRRQWTAANPGKQYVEPKGVAADGLPALPEGWVWATVEQVTTLVTSGSRGWAAYYAEQGPLFIRAQDINTDRLVLDDVAHVSPPRSAEGMRTRVKQNDLLITITGANVTKAALAVPITGEAYVSQHVALARPTFAEVAAYLYYWIVSPANGRFYLNKWAYGAGKPGLSLENVRELPVALPPLQVQLRIVSEIERHLSVANMQERELRDNLARAERLRQAVLGKAFRGELV